jgi:hypothetical protein
MVAGTASLIELKPGILHINCKDGTVSDCRRLYAHTVQLSVGDPVVTERSLKIVKAVAGTQL